MPPWMAALAVSYRWLKIYIYQFDVANIAQDMFESSAPLGRSSADSHEWLAIKSPVQDATIGGLDKYAVLFKVFVLEPSPNHGFQVGTFFF